MDKKRQLLKVLVLISDSGLIKKEPKGETAGERLKGVRGGR